MAESAKDPRAIAAALVQEIQARGQRTGLLGAQAGLVARRADPEFDPRSYGVEKLSEFIERHVPAIRPIAASGQDVVYGLAKWPDISGYSRPASVAPDPWRIWTSPQSRMTLGVNRETLQVRPSLPGATGADEIEIFPVSPEFHMELAESFISQTKAESPALASELEEALKEHPSSWWRVWSGLFAAQDRGSQSRWLAFRHRRLQDEFATRLVEGGLSGEEAALVVHGMRRRLTEAAARSAKRSNRSPSPGSTPGALERGDLISVVRSVVGQMSDEELRRLLLPVGLVLDALHE
ncbi:MAG: hypothetical protein ACKVZ0_15665 [Gemmatimonadales bacterium]